MDTMTIVIIAVAGVSALILLIWFFTTWNRLINLDENAQNAWNNIDVLLNQRYDMIPNMVNIVKGYAEHEAGIFDQFAVARQTAAGALAQGDVAGVAAAEGVCAPRRSGGDSATFLVRGQSNHLLRDGYLISKCRQASIWFPLAGYFIML